MSLPALPPLLPEVPRLVDLPLGELPCGVYRLISRTHPTPILTMITDWGWHAGYINGNAVEDKAQFLRAAGEAWMFPPYYGHNWDAFEEMVNDLSWLEAAGTVVLYDRVHRLAATQPDAWRIALSILQAAAGTWQREGRPFYVLLRQNWRWNRHLPRLIA